MNCKPGDLAIVIESIIPLNVGKIVQVIEPYGRQTPIVLANDGALWLCESMGSPLRWEKLIGVGFTEMQAGPIPDYCLRPLPGQPESEEFNTQAETSDFENNKLLA